MYNLLNYTIFIFIMTLFVFYYMLRLKRVMIENENILEKDSITLRRTLKYFHMADFSRLTG